MIKICILRANQIPDTLPCLDSLTGKSLRINYICKLNKFGNCTYIFSQFTVRTVWFRKYDNFVLRNSSFDKLLDVSGTRHLRCTNNFAWSSAHVKKPGEKPKWQNDTDSTVTAWYNVVSCSFKKVHTHLTSRNLGALPKGDDWDNE